MIVRAMLMVVIVTLFFSGMTTDLIKIIFKEIFGGCGRMTEQCVVPQLDLTSALRFGKASG